MMRPSNANRANGPALRLASRNEAQVTAQQLAPSPVEYDAPAQLRLAHLHAPGVLTGESFTTRKAQILGT